jgi:ABC-2 type transport system permease protein
LSVLRFGFSTFFSGQLIPLEIMPDWLRQITATLPFSHALYTPVSILSGITPVAEAPRIWLVELGYLLVFGVLSRFVFRIAVRKVTVQGG